MEKAQELAQGSKQEQHIPDLAQKAHDIPELHNSLAGGKYKPHTQFAYSFGGWKWVVSGIGISFLGFCFLVCICITNQISLQFIYLSNKYKH